LPDNLNFPDPGRDQGQAPGRSGGFFPGMFMKTIRPDNTDPIPLRQSPHRVGTIMLRFGGLLLLAIVVLVLVWSR
jgi:hypothetical protein